MKNILLIIYDPALNSEVLRDRIKSLGPCYTFWNNHWFVESNLSAKDAYEKIITNSGFEFSSMIVLEVPKASFRYYGRMNTTLWEWLKDRLK